MRTALLRYLLVGVISGVSFAGMAVIALGALGLVRTAMHPPGWSPEPLLLAKVGGAAFAVGFVYGIVNRLGGGQPNR